MNYQQLTDAQRYQIETYLKVKYSLTRIAKEIGVNKSTISREVIRNSKKRAYSAYYAQVISDERRKEAYKHSVFDINMKRHITEKLVNSQWSPEQIKGRCTLDGIPMVSIERIYQFIYEDQSKEGGLYLHLRTARRWRRKRLNRKHQRGQIPNRVMIGERPEIVQTKGRFGDWEVDTIIGKNHQTAILTATERKSQFELMAKTDGTKADSIKKEMINLFAPFKELVRTITSDNGKEFAQHQRIAEKLQSDFYFADPYSPWQRGLNEYNNKLIRQYLPKKTDFNLIDNKTISMIINKLNNRPRKLLGYKTPNEVFLTIFNPAVALIN